MKIMRKPAVRVVFCAIVFTAVLAAGQSDNIVTAKKNLRNNCEKWDLSLNFSNTVISTIRANFISSPIITCLNLEESGIQSVQNGAFDALPALEYLNMAGNRIKNLLSFGGHENLRVLILANQSSNHQSSIINYRYDPYYEPMSRQSLHSLDIHPIRNFPKLHSLDLSGNNINSINNSWDKDMQMSDVFPKLTYLDLSNNCINQFVPNAKTFMLLKQNLTHLYLHGNNIEYGELTHFKNLKVLTLDNNNIEYLRRNFCTRNSVCLSHTSMLKYFSIANNKLTHIDEDFFKTMSQLVSLNLSNNSLHSSLHGMFDKIISLEDLSIDNNEITNVSISNRPLNLHSLSLNWNNIRYIDSNDLTNIPLLRKLYLNNNQIKRIHKNAFLASELLEELHLASNNLIELPADWSVGLRNLRYLDLTNNAFMYLESLSFSNTVPLIDVYLINNHLISLKSTVFHDLPGNVTIYLIDNQRKNEAGTSDYDMTTEMYRLFD